MLYPIFYGFIAPDIASAKPLSAMKVVTDLAAKLNAQVSVAIGALQISVPNILGSATVEGLIANENKRSADSAAAAREQITGLACRPKDDHSGQEMVRQ